MFFSLYVFWGLQCSAPHTKPTRTQPSTLVVCACFPISRCIYAKGERVIQGHSVLQGNPIPIQSQSNPNPIRLSLPRPPPPSQPLLLSLAPLPPRNPSCSRNASCSPSFPSPPPTPLALPPSLSPSLPPSLARSLSHTCRYPTTDAHLHVMLANWATQVEKAGRWERRGNGGVVQVIQVVRLGWEWTTVGRRSGRYWRWSARPNSRPPFPMVCAFCLRVSVCAFCLGVSR